MNELPTEERCRKIMLSRIMRGEIQYFSESERPAIKRWAEENGHDLLKMNDGETAARILSEHYGAPSALPEQEPKKLDMRFEKPAEISLVRLMLGGENVCELKVYAEALDRLNLKLGAEFEHANPEPKPSPLPERDEATGTGPATADRPADLWKDNPPATVTQRSVKLPLGIMPEWRWKELRAKELMETIGRYIESGDPITEEWGQELTQLIDWITVMRKPKHPGGFASTKDTVVAPGSGTVTDFPNIKRDEDLKLGGVGHVPIVPKEDYVITKTQTDAKTYTDPKPWPIEGGYTKDQEIRELRYLVDEQKAIIANLEKRLEAGLKRGQMVRDLLSQGV